MLFIFSVNDLILFKKEVDKLSFYSFVLIVMNEIGVNLDMVVDSLVDMLCNIGDSMNWVGDSLIVFVENSYGV